MKFVRNSAVVELDDSAVSIHAGDRSWPFYRDESRESGGVVMNTEDAEDVLAALWVCHLARQGVSDDTLKIGADLQGVTIIRESKK